MTACSAVELIAIVWLVLKSSIFADSLAYQLSLEVNNMVEWIFYNDMTEFSCNLALT